MFQYTVQSYHLVRAELVRQPPANRGNKTVVKVINNVAINVDSCSCCGSNCARFFTLKFIACFFARCIFIRLLFFLLVKVCCKSGTVVVIAILLSSFHLLCFALVYVTPALQRYTLNNCWNWYSALTRLFGWVFVCLINLPSSNFTFIVVCFSQHDTMYKYHNRLLTSSESWHE